MEIKEAIKHMLEKIREDERQRRILEQERREELEMSMTVKEAEQKMEREQNMREEGVQTGEIKEAVGENIREVGEDSVLHVYYCLNSMYDVLIEVKS